MSSLFDHFVVVMAEQSYDVMTVVVNYTPPSVVDVASVCDPTTSRESELRLLSSTIIDIEEEMRDQRTIPVEESNDDYKMNRKIRQHEIICISRYKRA
jgi:hypothetical protein